MQESKTSNHITLPIKTFKEIEGYKLDEMLTFARIFDEAKIKLMVEKDTQYGGSWQKDGLIGAFFNLKRKMDRLIQLFRNGAFFSRESKAGETSLDTLIDLSNYTTMNVYLMFRNISSEPEFREFTSVGGFEALRDYFFWDTESNQVKHLTT